MTNQQNNILVGLLVIVSIAAASGIAIWLGGARERFGSQEYVVAFDLREGVAGLESGSLVTVGGAEVGAVVEVLFYPEPAVSEPTEIHVIIRVDEAFVFKKGIVAYLVAQLLGGNSSINFDSLGDGAVLGVGDLIDGRLAPPSFLTSAGIGEEQTSQVKGILQSMSTFMEKANNMADLGETVTEDVQAKWPEWSEQFDRIMANVDQTAESGPKLASDLEAGVAEGRETLASAKGYLDEHEESVRTIVSNIEAGTEDGKDFVAKLNGELTDKFKELVDAGQRELDKVGEVLTKANATVDEELPSVRRSLANFRLASDQLTATTSEIRRSPWRLLYRPDTRELEFELLYDAARSYAGAVSDLRTASESMESSIDAMQSSGDLDHERLDRLVESLDAAFGRYKVTEQQFLDLVTQHAGGN